MLNDTSRWSHARGNEVVPSPWQATGPPLTDTLKPWLGVKPSNLFLVGLDHRARTNRSHASHSNWLTRNYPRGPVIGANTREPEPHDLPGLEAIPFS